MLENIAATLLLNFLTWKPVIIAIGIIWGATVTFYLLFLVFACYRRAVEEGTVVPKFSKAMIAPALLGGAVLDVVWNYLIGSILFLELPDIDEPGFAAHTFTHRLKQHVKEFTWRGVQARFFAQQLNWADPEHVK